VNDEVEAIVTGAVIELEPSNTILLIASLPEHLVPPSRIRAHGRVVLRASLAFLYSPDALIVQRVVDDFGRDYRGEAAFKFMLHKGDAFPRSDVFGRRTTGHEVEQVFLKQLDLAHGVQVYAYRQESHEFVAHIDSILVIEGVETETTIPQTILSGISYEVVSDSYFRSVIAARTDNDISRV